MNPPKFSQKGMGLILAVMAIAVMMGILLSSIGTYYYNYTKQITWQQDRIVALQVLQDFALLAQKAHDRWTWPNGGTPGVCPFSLDLAPDGFCWGIAPDDNCVRDPRAADDPTANLWLCRNSGTPVPALRVSSTFRLEPKMTPWQRFESQVARLWKYRKEIATDMARKTVSLLDGRAFAQSLYLPDLTGAPIGDAITRLDCRLGVVSDFCKVCDAPPVVGNLTCAELEVCMWPDGCPSPLDVFVQRIGVLDR